MIVVADTTPLISLMKAARLDILEPLFNEVLIPQAVYEELTTNPDFQDLISEKVKRLYTQMIAMPMFF